MSLLLDEIAKHLEAGCRVTIVIEPIAAVPPLSVAPGLPLPPLASPTLLPLPGTPLVLNPQLLASAFYSIPELKAAFPGINSKALRSALNRWRETHLQSDSTWRDRKNQPVNKAVLEFQLLAITAIIEKLLSRSSKIILPLHELITD